MLNLLVLKSRLKRENDKKVESIHGYFVFNERNIDDNLIISYVLGNII